MDEEHSALYGFRMLDVPKLADTAAQHEALLSAINVLGSQGKLAQVCGCTPANIWQLVKKRRRLAAEHVLAVEAATGISRHLLRPDIYPVEVPALAPAEA